MKHVFASAVAALILLQAGAVRAEKYCLAEDGQRYKTQREACPEGQTEVRKEIRSCLLADGSRGFGDSCLKAGAQQPALDAETLANRSKGAGKQDIDKANRGLQQVKAERTREQYEEERIAAQRRAADAQAESLRAQQKRDELRKRQQQGQ